MKIVNNFLYDNSNKQVEYKPTPNKAGKYIPQYLVMHYTAATQAKGAVSWFLSREAKASAHLIIDRDGSIVQFAPFNIITWHAGVSSWNGLIGMNQYAIGIELVNGGRLARSGGVWICAVDKRAVADSEVIIARHKNESVENGWQSYTDVQLQVAIEVGSILVKTYNLKDVIGHEDIAPHRKSDPGPAFPMSGFRSKVMGRKENTDIVFITSTIVNIRSGAGTSFPALTDLLPKDTKVHILKRDANWSFVEVIETVHGLNDIEGWINSRYLLEK